MRDTTTNRRLLFVGNSPPYKNLSVCLRAQPILRQSFSELTWFLTWPANSPLLAEQQGFVGVGYLHTQDLVDAYSSATALVMPSLVETVGLPMLEAMSCGCPVIAADRPYAHDVCQDAALFFDPNSPEDLARQVSRLLTEPGLRETLIATGHALVERRRADRPYERMLDRLVDIGLEAKAKRRHRA